MNRTGRTLVLGCLLLVYPLLASAGGNSLLVPAMGRCTLNTQPENLPAALEACQQAAKGGDAQAQYELGEFYYEGKNAPRDLPQALNYFEQASLQGHAQAQYQLGLMFSRGEGVQANNIQAYVVLKMAAVNGSEEALSRQRCRVTSLKWPLRYSGRFSASTCLNCRPPKGAVLSLRCPDQESFRAIAIHTCNAYFSGIGMGNGITLLVPRASLIFGVPMRSTSSMRTIECIGTKLRTTPSNWALSFSSLGSTTTVVRSPKTNSSTSRKPHRSLW
ncbi:Sel1 repeat-containing protein [Pseudomonas syringae pv. atrofaciens]|nr:Sel1 repeat-containing protein [Pseudomonas syringae pv. atrofaciens]